MQFNPISIQSIRSAEQRHLISVWDMLAGERAFPSFLKLKPDLQSFNPKQLVVWTIESAAGRRCYRALFNGSHIGEVFNSAWAGKTMDSVIPEPLKDLAIEAADECAVTGCAIYTILSTTDGEGRRIDCERLLLPFGRNGGAVEQLVGSLQLVSAEGAVKRSGVLEKFQRRADVILGGKIASGFTDRQAITSVQAIDASSTVSQASRTADQRRAPRQKLAKSGTISFGGTSMTCAIRDISKTGAALEVSKPTGVPDAFRLVLEMESMQRHCVVVWRNARRLGVRFH
jgi:hypothetical protein